MDYGTLQIIKLPPGPLFLFIFLCHILLVDVILMLLVSLAV